MKRFVRGVMLGSLIGGVAPQCWAQSASGTQQADLYPNRPIRFIIPVAPGGGTDILARAIGQKLSDNFGRPVVMDNRAGGNATIGTDIAAKAAPDGYTLMMATNSFAVLPALYQKLSFDVFKDFAPVTLVATVANFLVVHPSVSAKTVKELIAMAKARPGQLNFAVAGAGGSARLGAELFKVMAGIDVVMIPYKGGGLALIDLLAGQVQTGFPDALSAMSYIKAGRLRALGVTSRQRLGSLPDVPTISEAGVPGYEAIGWHGVLAPAGTPKHIVSRLNAEIVRILRASDVAEKLSSQEAVIAASSPEEFASYIRAEYVKWSKVVKDAGIKPE